MVPLLMSWSLAGLKKSRTTWRLRASLMSERGRDVREAMAALSRARTVIVFRLLISSASFVLERYSLKTLYCESSARIFVMLKPCAMHRVPRSSIAPRSGVALIVGTGDLI